MIVDGIALGVGQAIGVLMVTAMGVILFFALSVVTGWLENCRQGKL
jgi:hypothetical protein